MKYSFMKPEESWQDGQSLQDLEYFQSCYPESMRHLQTYVAAECDKMDYEGSPMYDQYPDRVLIDRMCDSICRCLPDEIGISLMGTGLVKESPGTYGDGGMEYAGSYELLQGQQFEGSRHGRPPHGRPPGPRPPQGPPPGHRPPWGPPPWGPPPGHRPPQGPPPWGPPPGPRPPQGPPPWGPPPGHRPPQGGPNWTQDLIRILLLNEMQRRRCQKGRCF